jgi:hypothetical protein
MKNKHRHPHNTNGGSLNMIRHYFPKVARVEDSTKATLVEVTPADASHGTTKNPKICALALACKRTFKADGVIIGLTTSWIIKGDLAIRYKNTDTISREITSFDRKGEFDPGIYGLSPISPAARLGTVRHTNSKRSGRITGLGAKKFRHFTRGVRVLAAAGTPRTA